MDVFMELMVERKRDARENTLRVFIILSAVSLSFLIILATLFLGYLPLVIVIGGVIWLTSYILKGLYVEYEYILTNKDLDVDKITGKRKRKRLVTLDLLTAYEFARYDENTEIKPDVTVAAHDNSYQNLWYLTAKHASLGKTLLLFTPTDKFAAAVNDALPPRYKNRDLLKGDIDGD